METLLKQIVKNTAHKTSFQIIVSDRKSSFNTRLNPTLQLDSDKKYEIALVKKIIILINKMEVKENIHPRLPMAPPIEDQGQGYRLQKINEIQAFLEKEVATREALSRKYFRAASLVANVDTVLIAITLGGGAGGIGLLSMVIAAPTVIVIEGVALFTGLLSIIGK